MIQANIHDAKTRLSELLAAAERGEEVIIARAGKPIARLTAIAPTPKAPRPRGIWLGLKAPTDEEWAQMDAEIAAEFERSINQPIE